MPPDRSSLQRGRLGERVTGPLECGLGELDPSALRGRPRLGFGEQLVHLGEQRARRCALALERLDPAQPPEHRVCFVHVPNVARQLTRVCVGTVPKGIPFVPSVAASPDRDLGEARAAIDRGDSRSALKSLDRARKGYARALDTEGLEHVLDMAALVDTSDDRSRIGRDNLVYAVKQNLRQESRRRARQLGRPWSDPFPDLQAPTEHTGFVFTRAVKLWIAIGVAVAIAAFVGFVLVAALVDTGPKTTVTVRLTNDTGRSVTLRKCDGASCDMGSTKHIDPGNLVDAQVDANLLVQVFRLEWTGPDECLPLRVHDAYQRIGGSGALGANLSQATPCPGTTVLPRRVGPEDAQL
jgi:hypothetical protein